MLHPRCLFSFLGLCLVISLGLNCDARAVNVSNTWTMPQEGLNVFYRFFRDRISWFEADAVCQFHHANLVTVDNSFQFDATRDLLRELDVNDIVWIGLMRPQNSHRFMWSNSRPLVADTGYWAESLPLMDAPLCAVIDPIRDYRWHALRCGGPETASFLCEMPVPSWADACILKDMPNLTMQYMADTASIELIRNCQEEGLLRHTCKGKEDRERAIGQLICPKERLEAQRITDITNSHFKSLQIIKNIRTDNNENNDIDLLPNYGSRMAINIHVAPPVPRVSSVPGLGELMQSDAPGTVSMSGLYRIPDQVPKPVKKAAKKVIVPDFAKKLQSHQQHQQQQQQQQLQKSRKTLAHQQEQEEKELKEQKEEMMMGDQPALSEEQLPPGMAFGMGLPLNEDEDSNSDASNEIFEHLPHKKKILPQDLRTMSPILEAKTTPKPIVTTISTTGAPKTETTETVAEIITTPKAEIDTTSSQAPATTAKLETTTITTTNKPITTTAKVVKAEPELSTTTRGTTTSTVKPQQETTTTEKPQESTTEKPQQSTTTTTEKPQELTTTTTKKPQQSTTTEKPQESTTPTTVKQEQSTTTITTEKSQQSTTTTAAPAAATSPITTATPTLATTVATTAGIAVTSRNEANGNMAHPIHPSQQQQHHQQQQQQLFELQQQHATHVNESADNTRFIPPMLLVKSHYVPPSKHASEHATLTTTPASAAAAAAAVATTTVKQAEAEPSTVTSSKGVTAATSEAPPAAVTAQPATAATADVTATTGTTAATTVDVAKTSVKTAKETTTTPAAAAATATPRPATATAAASTVIASEAPATAAANEIKSNATPPAAAAATATAAAAGATSTTAIPEKLAKKKDKEEGISEVETASEEGEPPEEEAATTRHNFLEETEAPFKPNRRRSLTKPETVSYFKKILG